MNENDEWYEWRDVTWHETHEFWWRDKKKHRFKKWYISDCLWWQVCCRKTAQLDPTVNRHEQTAHAAAKSHDLGEITVDRCPRNAAALHLGEFGSHGHRVPEHVRNRVTGLVGLSWSAVWDNNYVLLWKPSRPCKRCLLCAQSPGSTDSAYVPSLHLSNKINKCSTCCILSFEETGWGTRRRHDFFNGESVFQYPPKRNWRPGTGGWWTNIIWFESLSFQAVTPEI